LTFSASPIVLSTDVQSALFVYLRLIFRLWAALIGGMLFYLMDTPERVGQIDDLDTSQLAIIIISKKNSFLLEVRQA